MENNFKTLQVDDTIYKTILTPKYEARKPYVKPDPRQLFSHLPGTMGQIHVKEGAKVKKGDLLFIVVSMKMNNRVLAPFDGEINKIHVTVGQRIPKGSLIAEYK
jgi:biotin carboxyl carrier protein